MNLSIIIPCYNESDNIANLRRQITPTVTSLAETRTVELILVDDGSQDGTWETLHQTFPDGEPYPAEVRFERHPTNLGLGAAIRTGFREARGDLVLTTDSDGTYRFETIPALLSTLTPEKDLVTASPYHPQGSVDGVPPYRLLLSKGSSLLYRILLNWKIYTYTALFRVYRRKVVESVPFESNGYLAGTEILVNSLLMGFQVAEYPAVLHSRVVGVSKARLVRTIRAHLRFQSKLLLHQLGIRPMFSAAQPKSKP